MANSKERTEAETQFKKTRKEQQANDGAKAMSEYQAASEAERAKTARLKALRLAREAAEKKPKQPDPTKKRLVQPSD